MYIWARQYDKAIIQLNKAAAIDPDDCAFVMINKAVEMRDALLSHSMSHPILDILRPDPRFLEILKKLNLEKYYSTAQ